MDTRATFPGGSEGVGLPGLRTYIKTNRQKDFVDNLSRKLLSYALGRSLSFTEAEVYAESQGQRTLVMKASATMALVPQKS